MRNIKLLIQYDGTDYHGWQIQDNAVTIQGILEDTLAKITGERLRVTAAARTDAGVHALGQVASFKTNSGMQSEIFTRAINANIPRDIRVVQSSESTLEFHPRFSAQGKTYFYLISTAYSIFLKRFSCFVPYALNSNLMKQAAEVLIGEHDFSSFRASGCSSKNPVRKITGITVEEISSIEFMTFNIKVPVIKISITANAFLRHMVRNIAGTLIAAGRGRITPAQAAEILESKDRRLAGPTAPPEGLFLERVVY
ncbi:MAG: tRNA pseudouridine(38-40) synthase TruA [Nitrospirae bacterium]|nr:tRNA pseudouridine(38-40) synthase TruA [Nitrospirota bacterium]MBI4838074.1 tRNA pseudouridine(38-40) synthase TruA [Nitrospirota bacterium]